MYFIVFIKRGKALIVLIFQHCKPAVDEDTFKKMVERQYETMKRDRQRQLEEPKPLPAPKQEESETQAQTAASASTSAPTTPPAEVQAPQQEVRYRLKTKLTLHTQKTRHKICDGKIQVVLNLKHFFLWYTTRMAKIILILLYPRFVSTEFELLINYFGK